MLNGQTLAVVALTTMTISLSVEADDQKSQSEGDRDLDGNAATVVLVDKQATAQTQMLFLLLRRLAEARMLFGHQDSTAYGLGWSTGREKSDVKEVTGSFPAVYGWDVGRLGAEKNLDRVDFNRMKQLIRDAHARGGINTISWHMDNPVTRLSCLRELRSLLESTVSAW